MWLVLRGRMLKSAQRCTGLVALRIQALTTISSSLPELSWVWSRSEALSVGLNVGEPLRCQELSSLARPSRTSGNGRPHSSRSRSPHETARPLARPYSFKDWRREARGPRRPAVEAAAPTKEAKITSGMHRRPLQDGRRDHAGQTNRALTKVQLTESDARAQDEMVISEIGGWLSKGGVSGCHTELKRRPDLQTAEVMGLVSRAPFEMEQKVSILWHMLTFGVQPSRQILFQMLEWTSMNSEAALFELVTQPLTNGPPPGAAAYSRLMKACAWHGRVSPAQQLLEHAINKGVDIGSDQYLAFWDAAMHTKNNRGNLEVLLARWKQVSSTGLPIHLLGYKPAVHALCLLHLTDLAKALVERLPRMGINVDTDMYRVLINGCTVAGMPEDAHRVLRVMEEEGLQATLPLWDIVLRGFAECGSIQQFKAVLRELAKRNFPRTKKSYVLELRAHLHNYDATGVLAVKDQLEATGEKLVHTACPELVHAYSLMGDMAAAHQAVEMLSSNGRDAVHVLRMTRRALLEWHARRGEFYEALELYGNPGRRSPWAVYALAEAAMQHWHQKQGAKETPLAACLLRGGPHAALPCKCQETDGVVHSTVQDLRLLHVAPSKRWSLGLDSTAILDLQGNNVHLVKYGHWMTQLCFLETLQSLMMQNKSGTPHMIVGAQEVQVTPNSTQGRYGLHYKRPELLMTLLKLMQNLGISAYVHNGRVICKPQELMRVVGEAERQGRQFNAATFKGCLVGLEPCDCP